MSSLSLSKMPSSSDIEVRENIEPENQTAESKTKPGPKPKYTMGEKCLYTHLVVTFCLFILVAIIYCVHLYIVNHDVQGIFSPYLRNRLVTRKEKRADYLPVGLVHVLPDSYMCNSILLNEHWSLAPAHCVAARSDPDLAYALPDWRIAYGNNNEHNGSKTDTYIKTHIKRSIPHPHFNRDDFQNNIGLFEHDSPVNLVSYVDINQALNDETLKENAIDLQLIGWEDSWPPHGHLVKYPVQPFILENCKMYVSPILELRAYERCVTCKMKQNVSIVHGAALAMKSKFVGLFSWGESRGKALPFVILDLAHFSGWIRHIVNMI